MVKGDRSLDVTGREVREMRNAETILGIIRERGRQRLPLGDVYRHLFNPALYLHSYARLYRNDGAMTKGVTAETVDGMSLGKINGIIERVRRESYRWSPVRRVYIPKPKHNCPANSFGICHNAFDQNELGSEMGAHDISSARQNSPLGNPP